MSGFVVGWVTCSSRTEARRLAAAVLNEKLAACVNIMPGIESHYWWKGKLDRSKEFLLMIKTTRAKAKAVMQTIRQNHSYEVPEIIFTSITAGERRYLKWLRGCVAVALFALIGATCCRADAFDSLVKQLGSTNEEVRADAAAKIAQFGGPRAQKKFREMITSDSPERRQMAVVGLLQASDEAADLELVHQRLKDDNSTVRWSAALALGESGRSEVAPWLEEAAKADTNDEVREAAAAGMAKLQSTIRWVRNYRDALKQARESKKPVLAYFYMRGSDLCQQFEEGVLANKDVVAPTRDMVCVRLEVTDSPDEARKLDVRGAPSVLILDGQGEEVARAQGLIEKEKLAEKLNEAKSGGMTIREARKQAREHPDNVQANWQVAENYLDEGREELADPFLRNVINADEANARGHTDRAMFALGFSFGKHGQYAQEVYCMEELLKRFPNFKDRDKALYCLGLGQLAIRQPAKGREALEKLVAEYPTSGLVPNARQALDKLKGK